MSCKIRRVRREKVQTFRKDFSPKFSPLALIPRTQFGPVQIHPVGQHRQCLRRQLQLGGLRFEISRPGNVPCSKRLLGAQIPVPSKQMILIRVCRRLLNTNKAPCFKSSPKRSDTSACRPLKPLRMSHASTATNTFKLPEKLSMVWSMPAPSSPPAPPAFHPLLPGAPRRATAIATGSQPPPLGLIQRPLPIAAAGVAAPSLGATTCCTQLASVEYLIRSAAQTGAATHRCGSAPQECPAVEPSSPAAALGVRSRRHLRHNHRRCRR